MKKVVILTVAIVLSATVASRSKTNVSVPEKIEFASAKFSAKTFLATAD